MTKDEQIEVLEALATHYKTKSIELEQNLIVSQCEIKRYQKQLTEMENTTNENLESATD